VQTVSMSGGEPVAEATVNGVASATGDRVTDATIDGVAEATSEERRGIPRHTVRGLLASQGWGGVGLVPTSIRAAPLAQDKTGSKSLATIAAACLSIGAAAASFPLAKIMNTSGRRVGLRTGYLIGATGAGVALIAAITRSYPLLCVGVFGAGAGNASNLATR